MICPDCRGVWLDHGELDKIIDRSLQNVKIFPDGYFNETHCHPKGSIYLCKKREGLLGKIFDL